MRDGVASRGDFEWLSDFKRIDLRLDASGRKQFSPVALGGVVVVGASLGNVMMHTSIHQDQDRFKSTTSWDTQHQVYLVVSHRGKRDAMPNSQLGIHPLVRLCFVAIYNVARQFRLRVQLR
jgi:hypothetical protein